MSFWIGLLCDVWEWADGGLSAYRNWGTVRSRLRTFHIIGDVSLTQSEAQAVCRRNYTDLVTVHNQEQNEEVKLKGKNSIMSFWIGLLCDDWEWADGGLSGYRNWRGNNSQPFSCVELVKEEWSPAECNDPAYALCYSSKS
uniref:C-type lectin domain-containing protein n=1 Tax=Electrophorus electricus TaxID=8005 RepID=A0AAY5EV17_ELEEL